MKKIGIVFAILTIFTIIFISCESNPDKGSENLNVTSLPQAARGDSIEKQVAHFVIFDAQWNGEFGRTSKECHGFGLCNFSTCWFCCENESHVIVDCQTGDIVEGAEVINIHPSTGQGNLLISMDPNDSIESLAINNKWTLYVDEDITNDSLTVHKGDYKFDNTIGSYGGYDVLVSQQ